MAQIQSMTGFARARRTCDAGDVSVELKSVNGKNLDIRLRHPPGYESLDLPLRQLIQAAFARGSIQVNVAVEAHAAMSEPRINEAYLARLIALSSELVTEHATNPPSADGLLAIRGVIESAENGPDDAAMDALLEAARGAMDEAIAALKKARLAEGKAIAKLLAARLDEIADLAARAEADPSRTPDAIRDRLLRQLSLLMDSSAALDSDRLHAEAALLATKADIREEIDRLVSHVDAARALVAEGGPVGRRLDFLAQEINREANTLCSKSNAVSVTAIGVELKVVTDQFREQVQNLE